MSRQVWTSRVLQIRDLSRDVRELLLSSPDPQFHFRPGQWISLRLPVGEHPPLIRAYSLAAAPRADGLLQLCFDLAPNGEGSTYLYSLQTGQEIEFNGPLGRFVPPQGCRSLLWVARFTGIVPFRAMLQELRQAENPPRVRLLYSLAPGQAGPYLEELQQAAASTTWFEVQVAEEVDEAGERALQALDLMRGDENWGPGDPAPMVCGRHAFVQAVRRHLESSGYGRREVLWEYYD